MRFVDKGKATLRREGPHSPTGMAQVAWERVQLRSASGTPLRHTCDE
jgi:hypothetical protein